MLTLGSSPDSRVHIYASLCHHKLVVTAHGTGQPGNTLELKAGPRRVQSSTQHEAFAAKLKQEKNKVTMVRDAEKRKSQRQSERDRHRKIERAKIVKVKTTEEREKRKKASACTREKEIPRECTQIYQASRKER